MADLFPDTRIVQLKGDFKGPRVVVKFDGSRMSDKMHLLSVEGTGQSNIQIDMTFNEHLIVTAFGERVTPLTFRGVSLPGFCDSSVSDANNLGAFYRKYRAGTNKTKTPVCQLSFEGNVFEGILTGMALNPYKLQDIDAFSYALTVQGSFQ